MQNNEAIRIYGGVYRVIPTSEALEMLKKTTDDGEEPAFWRVAVFGRETLWMNNFDGEIIITTDGAESYYRMF